MSGNETEACRGEPEAVHVEMICSPDVRLRRYAWVSVRPAEDRPVGIAKEEVLMKLKNLMLAVFGLVVLAGAVVPAQAAGRHHHRHHHHRHHHH